jgi:hypothetical protein
MQKRERTLMKGMSEAGEDQQGTKERKGPHIVDHTQVSRREGGGKAL